MSDTQDGSTEPTTLLEMKETVDLLVDEVEVLNDRLDLSEIVVKRGKRNQRFIAGLLCVALVSSVVLGVLYKKTNDALDQARANTAANKANAVQGCKNGNDSRQGALLLWETILNIPSSAPQTAQQKQATADFKVFVEQLYAPHDCASLGKKYPLPKPPASLLGK